MTIKNKNTLINIIAWFSVSIFYLYQYVLRVYPNVLVNDIRPYLNMTASEYSLFGTLTLYAYSLMQLPFGYLIDKYGVKIIIIFSITISVFGTYLNSLSHSHELAYLSRFLIGIGSASPFICAVKIASDNFNSGTKGFLMGATLSLGTIGAFMLSKSIAVISSTLGWHQCLEYIAITGIIILVINLLLLKENKTKTKLSNHSFHVFISALKATLKNKKVWYYSIMASGLYSPVSVIADLWGSDFIQKKYFFSSEMSASSSTVFYTGIAFGGLIISYLAEQFKKIDFMIAICMLCSTILIICFIYTSFEVSYNFLTFFLFIIGAFCGAEMICFSGAIKSADQNFSGITIGISNTLNMIVSAIIAHFTGVIMDKVSMASDMQQYRDYKCGDFQKSFVLLISFMILCSILSIINLFRKYMQKRK